jgi:hypothetical protein
VDSVDDRESRRCVTEGDLALGRGQLLAAAAIGLRVGGISLGLCPLEHELQRCDVCPELHQILLGGGTRHLSRGGASAERNEKGEEEAEPHPRPGRHRR